MTAQPMGGTDPSAEANASDETGADDTVATTVADEPTKSSTTASESIAESPAVAEASSNGVSATASATSSDGAPSSAAAVAPAEKPAAEALAGDTVPAAEAVAEDAAAAETVAEDAEAEVADTAPAALATADEAPATTEPVAGEDGPAAEPVSAEAPATTEPAAASATAAIEDAAAAELIAEPPAAEAPAAEAPAAEGPAKAPVVRREGPEPTTMEELLSETPEEIRSLKHGDVVEGAVVRIDKDEILVDIGAKSEGVVSNRELYGRHAEQQPVLNVGDTVLVYVLQPESEAGHAVLSLRRAGLERKWRSMQELFEAGTIIEAPVIDHNKGGLIVDCGIRGFVPISQIVDFPRRPQNDQPRDAAQEIAEKLQPFVGRKLRLKILEVNRKANRLILSEKVALYEERREKRDELFSSLQVSQRVTGTVRSIAPFGIFIDLGGIDGLVHKSELSWNKVNNPEAGYKVGDEVEAEVIDINHERGRISLSIRRLQPDPWNSTVADFKVGDVIEGTVTKIVNFGAFVRVRDGLEGLIHISELSHQRVAHPGDVVHEGQTLHLKIISLDSERHRLGLSLKQAEETPVARPTAEPRERRGRTERSYDASQAVQEPEGGIDNTLAAAFAQVREQMAASEAEEDVEVTAELAADETVAVAKPVADESVAEEAGAEPAVVEAATADQANDEVAATAEQATDEPAATAEQTSDEPVTAAEQASDEPAEAQAGEAEEAADAEEADDAAPRAVAVGSLTTSGTDETVAPETASDAGPATGGAVTEEPSSDEAPAAPKA